LSFSEGRSWAVLTLRVRVLMAPVIEPSSCLWKLPMVAVEVAPCLTSGRAYRGLEWRSESRGAGGPAEEVPQRSGGRRATGFLSREEGRRPGKKVGARRCGGRTGPMGPHPSARSGQERPHRPARVRLQARASRRHPLPPGDRRQAKRRHVHRRKTRRPNDDGPRGSPTPTFGAENLRHAREDARAHASM
jgi:hypothetical protein